MRGWRGSGKGEEEERGRAGDRFRPGLGAGGAELSSHPQEPLSVTGGAHSPTL